MIAFDLDDVILNLTDVLSPHLKSLTGIDTRTRTEFYAPVPDGMSNNTFRKIFNELSLKYTIKAKPVKGSIDALENIYKLTNEPIHIITARKADHEKIVNKWMKINVKDRFPYHIDFSGSVPKYKYFKSDTKYFVDDALHNVEKLCKYLDIFFIFDRPWNRNSITHKNVIRIKYLKSVYIFLKNTKGRGL